MSVTSPLPPSSTPGQTDDGLTPAQFAGLLGLLLLATFPEVLSGARTFSIRDYGLFSHPVAFFHRECFWHGEIPLWNPLNHCGLPFLAQWNTLTLYPPSLIYLLLPLTWSLPLFCLAHLLWAGLGMHLLAREWTGHRWAAALAGIIFAFNGLALNFLMWPSHVATFAWLPWVVWLVPRACQSGGKSLFWALLAAAMQMLAGGPETIIFTWLLLSLLTLGRCWREPRTWKPVAARFFGIALLVAVLCAAQLLPFLQLLAQSQRDAGYGTSAWSMPPWGWAGFLVPLFRSAPIPEGVYFQADQAWTSSYYAGIGTLLLAAVAVWRSRDSRVRLLAALLAIALVLALGDAGFLYRALRSAVPALGMVRYPVKFVILILAVAPLLAAFGLATLSRHTERIGRFEWTCTAGLLALIGLILAFQPQDASIVRQAVLLNGLSRALLLVLVLVLIARFLPAQGRRRTLLGCALLIAFWLDFLTHAPDQNPTVPPSVYASGWIAERAQWNPRPALGQSRLMLAPAAREAMKYHSLSNAQDSFLIRRAGQLPDCNLLDALPLVGGFFSLTPAAANEVTVAPYVYTNADFSPLLDFMAVSQITAPGTTTHWIARPTAMPLVTAGQQPRFADNPATFTALYQTNTDLRTTVFLPLEARAAVSATRQTAARVLATRFTHQRVLAQVEAPAPSIVVIAQSWYPAWKARIDGQPTPLWRANYAFQAIQIPAGRHDVELVYQDTAFLIGALLSAVGLLSCACAALLAAARARPPRPQP